MCMYEWHMISRVYSLKVLHHSVINVVNNWKLLMFLGNKHNWSYIISDFLYYVIPFNNKKSRYGSRVVFFFFHFFLVAEFTLKNHQAYVHYLAQPLAERTWSNYLNCFPLESKIKKVNWNNSIVIRIKC